MNERILLQDDLLYTVYAYVSSNCLQIQQQARLADTKETSGVYECPVYATSNRGAGEYIASFLLKTGINPRTWVLAGVALLLEEPSS